ncbi:hypothetical protein ALC60_10377 [Trachymyrmex zeteki]|uniref:Uncharacterized protein n=1 Tax=Mycetomoellerius zeteki TaxID=64791 RepID=A0A151WRP8_9HYME|nr:hypothetical protein ALC60_10377 [Trachymyrmex zeteki]
MSMPTKGKHHHLSHHHHPQHHSQPQQHHQPQQQQPHHTPPQHQHQIILNQPVVHSPQTYSAVVTTNTRFLNAVQNKSKTSSSYDLNKCYQDHDTEQHSKVLAIVWTP